MRKHFNIMLVLAFCGAIISGILLYQHYFPEMNLGVISCGKGFSNPCIAIGQSPYSKLFGIPIAAYGVLYFAILTFMMLLADYAEEYYYHIFMSLMFPIVIAGVMADIILAVLMIKIGEICYLCVSTYIINIFLLALLYFYLKKISNREKLFEIIKNFFMPESPDRKAVLSLFVVFIFFLSFSVFAATIILQSRVSASQTPESKITKLISDFYNEEPQSIDFPETNMNLGNSAAKVKIYVFNDFLCSACYKFYNIEKYILARYKNKVEIKYYHYPLDSSCNKYMDETIYANSCQASRAMFAAASMNIFEEYFYSHFSNYPFFKDGYGSEQIFKNFEEAMKIKNSINDKKSFELFLNSKEATDLIKKHIEFAEKLKIEATPTIYIAGRKIVGVPPREFVSAIIDRELSK
ncbi:MAG TPA: thioredoxin domain-containing protein [Spirochaetota bacterium]|nr:thioredoxin domain-containing protein [Spirochaetota bacterium]HOK91653.1 thioredoxin domain-containing protein [Spirochaetota bacterium]HPD78398.1 thioredoxin domain-containing protein [Spirochaetota bacterium]HPP94711.1 thioredoxin domain-containing protein [Spirochaetota bacterium]HRU64593.1 thioredoxin domain-containing protein [Spirochaetota bacterium]